MHIEHFTPSVVSLEQVPYLWAENEVLVFIIDLKDHPLPDADHLNEDEKVHLNTLKTEYFKNRYTVSRLVLKYLVCTLKEKSLSEIATFKDVHGRVHVCDHSDLHICISYTEDKIALALSKIDVGIDIESMRSRSVTSILKSIDRSLPDGTLSEHDSDFLLLWTLKEAYCKYSNETMFSNLTKKLDMSGFYHAMYIIDNEYALAFITKCQYPKVKIVNLQGTDLENGLHH
ncbi:4'-phosphopantetheinyl transferase superfamily protein [Methanomethylovorans sp.]|uniref:4'-phosphopantetheinyl transferase family protein n=1 Tax=Methanomethylovorans sp. TaxID=2758717 RepID=UPI000B0E7035|nr:4'-phosphopantetheinyl transferase superfamily protein [Methanomethylovorans sp.]